MDASDVEMQVDNDSEVECLVEGVKFMLALFISTICKYESEENNASAHM